MIWRTIKVLHTCVNEVLRDIANGIGFSIAIVVFSAISLGFGTFGSFQYLSNTMGDVLAAMMISAFFASATAVTAIKWKLRTRSKTKPDPVLPQNELAENALLEALGAEARKTAQNPIASIMQVGGSLSSLQLVALALMSGFAFVQKPRNGPPRK